MPKRRLVFAVLAPPNRYRTLDTDSAQDQVIVLDPSEVYVWRLPQPIINAFSQTGANPLEVTIRLHGYAGPGPVTRSADVLPGGGPGQLQNVAPRRTADEPAFLSGGCPGSAARRSVSAISGPAAQAFVFDFPKPASLVRLPRRAPYALPEVGRTSNVTRERQTPRVVGLGGCHLPACRWSGVRRPSGRDSAAKDRRAAPPR